MNVTVVGGGLAGSEAAFQLAERGFDVTLVEQKPVARTPAQSMDTLAELVCSNSFRGAALTNAVGVLKEELRRAGSLILACADTTRVPAGGALAVDREAFSALVTRRIDAHPRIRRVAACVDRVPEASASSPVILATGPLTADALASDLARVVGAEHLAYYDAIAPIVVAESIDRTKVFAQSRWDKGAETDGPDGAYLNCPMDAGTYGAFVEALRGAAKVVPKAFEELRYFEGCLPVEVMAERGEHTLRYGPMKPVGLTDPRTGRWPYAVVQLRPEDPALTAYNLVGFQTRMTYPEQKRVFSMIPGLEHAEYLRLGSVHRNTFVDGPAVLDDTLSLRARPYVHLAGQITGVEGYLESAGSGYLVAILLAQRARGLPLAPPPPTTATGALYTHVRTPRPNYQPANVTWAGVAPLEAGHAGPGGGRKLGKAERYAALGERALRDFDRWCEQGWDARAEGALAAGSAAGSRVAPSAHSV